MKCLITGCAGFIGSHSVERFLAEGAEVVGIDNFDPYYARRAKEENLRPLLGRQGFRFIEGDLKEVALEPLFRGVDSVLHLAAQPGVRASWGDAFNRYLRNNVLCTQRLLEHTSALKLSNVVYASSSSVYGASPKLPVEEGDPPVPISPYGVTKLCAENLCEAYRIQSGVPVVRLRYFSVYGPRQRPDMLIHRIVRAAVRGEVLDIYGDGKQTRDFTFVGDVAQANWLAVRRGIAQGALNVASGQPVAVNEVVRLVEELAGRTIRLQSAPAQKGDPLHTHASVRRAKTTLGFEAKTPLREGLRQQLEWQRAYPE